jgi:hypothetical protein
MSTHAAIASLLALPALGFLAACDTPNPQTGPQSRSAATTPAVTPAPLQAAPSPQQPASQPLAGLVAATLALPAAGESLRLEGDPAITVVLEPLRKGGFAYRSGQHLVDTPLPVGYPRPTPPGTIELKHYPSIRRAEYGARVNADGTPVDDSLVEAEGSGMQRNGRDGFWPLFRHIQRRDIAMTSPVEMDWRGASVTSEQPMQDAKWTMSFLYREPAQGAAGDDPRDARVRIIDTKPAIMLSVGLAGRSSDRTINAGVAKLRDYLARNPQWQPLGDLRGLFYNDPSVPDRRAWAEIQIEVKPTAAPTN